MPHDRTIFFASERGANLGHLGRDLALAQAFQRNGDHVVLAVPDVLATQSFMGQDGWTIVQAPTLRAAVPARTPSINFADMLLNFGFADAEALANAIDAWLALFNTVKPALVVYNNAPTALIAARIAGLPIQLVGTAFEIPPASAPLPAFRPELPVTVEQLFLVEATVVAYINGQFARHGKSGITCIADLYPPSKICLTTLPELDPFGPRDDVAYVGPVFRLPPQPEVRWQSQADRVLVYLRPSVPGCEEMLAVLQESQFEVICMMPGCPANWISQFDRIRFYAHPLTLGFLLSTTHAVVTSGVGMIATCLLAGVPVVYMPQTVEQHLAGHIAVQTGAVILTTDLQSREILSDKFITALAGQNCRERAIAVATRNLSAEFENNAAEVILAAASSKGIRLDCTRPDI